MGTVSFPGLGLEFHLNRVAFHIGSWPVYWYGIIIAAGFLLAVLYCCHAANASECCRFIAIPKKMEGGEQK